VTAARAHEHDPLDGRGHETYRWRDLFPSESGRPLRVRYAAPQGRYSTDRNLTQNVTGPPGSRAVSAPIPVQSEAAGAGKRSVEVTKPFSSIEMSLCFSPPKINSAM
jgi:hypothetical protein